MLSRLLGALVLATGLVVAPLALAPASAAPAIVTVSTLGGSEADGGLTLRLSMGTPNDGFSFDMNTSNGSATEGADFSGLHSTYPVAGGTSLYDFTLAIADDAVYEGPETFTITLSNITGAALFSQTVITVTIADNDTVTYTITDLSAVESATPSFTVTRTGASDVSTTVDFATADGTATAGVDYTATSGTLTFAAGVSTQTIPVANLPDPIDEFDETYVVNLTNPSAGTITDAQGVGTIIDQDDLTSLTITPETQTVVEGDGGTITTLTYDVYRLGASAKDITFEVLGVDGTATQPGDYVVPVATYTIPAGPGPATTSFTIDVVGDDIYEGTERFRLFLANPVNASLAEVRVATVTISDDEPRPAALGVTGSNPTALLLTGLLALLGGVAMVTAATLRRRLA